MTELTCKRCMYFTPVPADALSLGEPPRGECRASPPGVVAVPARGGLHFLSMYPVVNEKFPSCGVYSEGAGPPPSTEDQAHEINPLPRRFILGA